MPDDVPSGRRDRPGLALQIPSAIAVIVMMVHVVANAVLRAYFESPIQGTLEYTQYWYLPIIAFIGLVLAQRRGEHVEAELLFDRFPDGVRHLAQAAVNLFTLVVCLAFTYYTFLSALERMSIGQTGGVIGVVIWPATFVVPIAFALLCLQLVTDTIRTVRGGARQAPEAADGDDTGDIV